MGGKYVKFREVDYIRDLTQALGQALDEIAREVHKHLLVNLASLKARKVDAEHVHTFPRALTILNRRTAASLTKHFGMSNATPNQTFRALYYEYGTGTKMRPPARWSPGEGIDGWNAMRPKQAGTPIYYRDRAWKDLGGNSHTGGVRQGVKKRIPQKNIYGHPVSAHFWFRNGLRSGTRGMDSRIQRAVRKVPITSYIEINDMRARM